MINKLFLFLFIISASFVFADVSFAQDYDFENSDFSYPSDAEGLKKLVEENLEKNERVEALKALTKLIELEPDNVEYLVKRADLKKDMKNYTAAIEDLNLVLEKGSSVDAMKMKADVLIMLGDDIAAFDVWTELAEKIGGVDGLLGRADFYKKNKRYDEARADLEKAKEIAESEFNKLESVSEQDTYKEKVLNVIDEKLIEISNLKISGA